jgi:tetratricopeptide (TPR) repeat protein
LVLAGAGCPGPQGPQQQGVHPPPNVSPLEKKFADNPNDPELNLEFGQRAESVGDLIRAEQYYLRAEALGIKAERVLPRILHVLVGAQRYIEALERCQKRLALVPGDRPTRFVEAALFVALEQPAKGERDLLALQRDAPDDPQAYLALGRLYRDAMHDSPRARAMFEKYLTLAPEGEDAAAVRFELADEATK